MAAASVVLPLQPQGSLPYPGVRPFEASESDRFFGRDRDADLLSDKILAGRLTVLYAQSGLGKSSLLRAKIVPRIEALHSRVIYFDAWAQESPLSALKDAMVRVAGELGIRDAGRGSPTLTELARLLVSRDDRALVLVLDQFEEFLVHHAGDLDPVRSELAALLRAAKLDAAVVLSLREEFLASLEPLRQQILNLFQSTYRLENLDEDGVRQAISRPAELFGGSCEPALVDRLIADLRSRITAGAAPGQSQLLELPMLQLVCRQLWLHAEEGRLTLALYQEMGGAQRILDEYVRGVMPKRWRDQGYTARLLLHLAPASGLKMSFAAGDLEAITGLRPSFVHGELSRLAAARILRTRVYRNAERYELQHDAFIPVLQAWRHGVIERERRLRWLRRLLLSAASVALVTAISSLFFHYQQQQASRMHTAEVERKAAEQIGDAKEQRLKQEELARHTEELARQRAEVLLQQNTELKDKLEHWQTGGIVTDLKDLPAADRARFAPSRFDVVTYYVLHRLQGAGRLQQLRNMLEENASFLPDDYGVLTKAAPDISSDWPLRLEYAPGRPLDPGGFDAFWQDTRSWIVSNWAIPLPTHVRLVTIPNLHGDMVRLVGGTGDGTRSDFTAPTNAGRYMISNSLDSLPPGPERDFIQKFDADWQHFSPRANIDSRLVPHWSLPVWRLLGQTAATPGGVTAYAAILEVLDNPEPLFSPEAVTALLDQTAKNFPNTVAEARAAAGPDLPRELAKRVKTNREALLALPRILDELGRSAHTDQPAEKISGNTRGSPGQYSTVTATARAFRLNGPWPKQPGKDILQQVTQNLLSSSGAERRSTAYDDFPSLLPAFNPIYIRVSNDLIAGWFQGRALSAPLAAEIAALRSDIYTLYGVNPPGFQFQPPAEKETLPPHTIFIDVKNDTPLPLVNVSRTLNGTDKLKSLKEELSNAIVATRQMWVTAEVANAALTNMPPNTREWIEKKYSLTDVKELMRLALSSKGSVRYPGWLIGSLPFWIAGGDDPLDGAALGAHLSETSRARREAKVEPPGDLRRHLESGADDLVAGNPDAAEAEFTAALRIDAKYARYAFPTVWASRAPDVWISELRRQNRKLEALSLTSAERSDLDDLNKSAIEQRNSAAVWRLGVYRLASDPATAPDRAATLSQLLNGAPDSDKILPDDARWLSLQFFEQYDPLHPAAGGEQSLAEAKTLIKSAVSRLEPADAIQAFDDLALKTLNGSAPNWAWPLLEQLANVGPNRPAASVDLEFAWQLCTQERPDQLHLALRLIDGYEKLVAVGKLSDSDLAVQTDNIRYVRARAQTNLQRIGEWSGPSPEPLLRRLLESKNSGVQQQAYVDLINVLANQRRFRDAEEVAKEATGKLGDTADVSGALLLVHLVSADLAGVRAAADSAAAQLAKAAPNDDVRAYLASLAETLAKRPGWQSTVEQFLPLQHPYTDYLRMIAAAYDPASARFAAELQKRWAGVDAATWPNRIRNGDASAWREMLIASFLRKTPPADLIATLTDERKWETSGLAQLPAVRRGLECEAWFYEAMRAKANGQRDRMLESLARCKQTGMKGYWEYAMATFLLAHPE